MESTDPNSGRANSRSSGSVVRDQFPTLYETQTRFLGFSRPVRDLGNAVKGITSGKEERPDRNGCNQDSKYSQRNTELRFDRVGTQVDLCRR